jgi:hypothetical protein
MPDRSLPARQGEALLRQLRETEDLAAFFAAGGGIRDVESEDAFLLGGTQGYKVPALLLWYGGEEEEREPSGVAMLTTHWRLTVLLPRIPGGGTDRFTRCDVVQMIKRGVLGTERGTLRDPDFEGASGLLTDYLSRWERVDALRPGAEPAHLRTVLGASFQRQIFETTREVG